LYGERLFHRSIAADGFQRHWPGVSCQKNRPSVPAGWGTADIPTDVAANGGEQFDHLLFGREDSINLIGGAWPRTDDAWLGRTMAPIDSHGSRTKRIFDRQQKLPFLREAGGGILDRLSFGQESSGSLAELNRDGNNPVAAQITRFSTPLLGDEPGDRSATIHA